MSNSVVGLFKCDGDLASFNSSSRPANDDIAWLLSNLEVRADVEYGIDPVEVEVIADGDVLYDIKLNGKSVGYFALRTFVNTLDRLSLPELIAHGPEANPERFDYQVYVIPLFGELEDVA